MRMRRLSDCHVPPGRLVRLRVEPDRDTLRDPAWPPPSYNQESRLRRVERLRASGAAYHAWYGLATTIAGRADLAALTKSVAAIVRRHTALRTGFRVSDGTVQRFSFGTGVRVDATPVGTFRDTRSMVARVHKLFDEEIDPTGWCPYAVCVAIGDDETTVCLAFDHTHTDLYSLAFLADEILTGGSPAPGCHLTHCAAERATASTPAAEAVWASFFRRVGPSASWPIELPQPRSATVAAGVEIRLADEATTGRFERHCRRAGGTVFAGLVAALALAARDVAGRTAFHTICPVSTRPATDGPSVGWFVNALPLSVDLPLDRSFDSILRAVGDAFRRQRDVCRPPYELVWQRLGDLAANQRVAWTSYVDYRRFLGSENHLERKTTILTCRTTGSGIDLWLSRNHSGTYLYARVPDGLAVRGRVADLARNCAATITAAADPALALVAPDGGLR